MDIRHRVLRLDTCLQLIRSLDKKENVDKELTGNIVITHYNKRTYKVNGINWEKHPLSTFEQKGEDGKTQEITFLDYYAKRFPNLRITDMTQPLLIHNPKRKDRHRGQTGPILLIPELCNLTGLSEDQRNNDKLMKAIHETTSMDPGNRVNRLQGFMRRLGQSTEVKEAFDKWGMKLDPQMVEVKGRMLKSEELFLANNKFTVEANADWSRSLRGKFTIFEKTSIFS